MARFRFVGADSSGTVHDGTIDAASQTDARNKLASNGLAVRELEEVATSAGASPPELPRRAAAAARPVVEDFPNVPMKRTLRKPTDDAPRRGSPATLLLSIAALVIALAVGAYVIYRDPPWGRLSRYDFSTPERAYTSRLRMEANADFQAMLELQKRYEGKQVREKLDTLQISKRESFGGKTVLFIHYELKGTRMHEIAFLEKDPERGDMWRPAYVADEEIRRTNHSLAEEIAQWRAMGRGGMIGPGGGGAWPP